MWTNLIEIFKSNANETQQQDVGLLLDAMTLVNKTLAGIPDQDTYYDFVGPLEELGIESFMKKFSHLDGQLREQFEIYEQVLRTEDEDNSSPSTTKTNPLATADMVAKDGPQGSSAPSERRKSNRTKAQQQTERPEQQVEGAKSENVIMDAAGYQLASSEAHKLAQVKIDVNKQHKQQGQPTHQQQQPSNDAIKHNLARGKQQRASISSCSSSDSYASYGSGYASGSGNSTDHEHKQKSLTNPVVNGCDQSVEPPSVDSGANMGQGTMEDEESQLNQHLSELEQLTDDLASRNIFGSLNQPIQSTSKHFSSTIKSTSSNSSSIISTGSNLSGLSSAANEVSGDLRFQAQVFANNESRSTSATPTSTNQMILSATTTTYPTRHINNSETPYQTQVARTNHKSASSATETALSVSSSSTTSSSSQPQQKQQQHQSSSPANTTSALPSSQSTKQEPYYHNLFQWEQLVSKGVTRPLLINDLDFTDLRDEDDCDLLNPCNSGSAVSRARVQATGEPLTISIPNAQQIEDPLILNGSLDASSSVDPTKSTGAKPGTPASAPPPMPPPPISPWFNTIAGSRPHSQLMSSPSPPYEYIGSQQQSSAEFNRDQSPANSTYSNYSRNSVCVPQTSTPTREPSAHHQYNTLQPLTSLRSASSMSSLLFGNNSKYGNKRKKTMKLFWKEVREDRSLLSKLTRKRTIWDEIKPVQVDTQKLEQLFESKAKDLLLSKSRNGLDGLNQRKVKITVLDAKRSNAINIGMTKLPPMRTIKSAILKMDSSIMNREGIEKILTTMMPTEEEKSRIIEAQLANPDTPLGTAEQFLLNLASISALEARLKLWAFQLDYAQIEKEVAEPLMDLKQAIEEIERSETFRIILGTLLAIGNFLNSTNAKGFQIDYLEKVPEVKDTVHKHSLLHHLCLFIQEKYDTQLTSDLYSEFSAVNRASKVDYTEVAKNLKKMQQDCKASWDYLKIVAKHDGLANLMNSCSSSSMNDNSPSSNQQPKSSGKLNNLSKLSMITTIVSSENSNSISVGEQQDGPTARQLKTKVSDFLTDCAERIMVLMVIHRRVMNRFQKLLVYLGCPSHQIKQTQPQQILKIINEFALEYKTKRERVRDMLMKKQQCHHHHLSNRWQLNRTRWAGSQQCIDSIGYNHHQHRPCSTTSSCASSYVTNNSICTDSMCLASLTGEQRQSMEHHHHHGNQHHSMGSNRATSPSEYSQISNYSDYLMDQSCCNSRQQSVTPVPSDRLGCHQNLNRRPHSMSISMLDLQNQHGSRRECSAQNDTSPGSYNSSSGHDEAQKRQQRDEMERNRKKDEQLRRVLGEGKSFDGACNDLYQMSHWSSTMARVNRPLHGPKQRAASMDSPAKDDEPDMSGRHQSSYYKYLHSGRCVDSEMEQEQNSDDDILQSLVRTATAKSSYSTQTGSHANKSTSGSQQAVNKGMRSRILSRFSCDRKSCKCQSNFATLIFFTHSY